MRIEIDVIAVAAWGFPCFIRQDSGEEASIACVDPCPSDQEIVLLASQFRSAKAPFVNFSSNVSVETRGEQTNRG